MLPQLFARIILGIGLPAISISGSLAQELPKFIAHRGASHDAPENTMSAFRLAWQQGADGIEGDFFLSKDGQIVCIHDKDTKRTGSENLPAGKSTLAELRKLEYGSWKDPKFKGEPLPLLGEVLDELPKEKWFLLEIKDTDKIVQPIAEILHLKKADPTRVVLISFDANVIKKCREIMPEYRACLLHALNDFNKTGQADKYLEIIKSSGSQGLAYKEQESIPAEWLSKIAGENQILASWTINTPESAARAVTRGVNFLITDRPGGLRGELEKRAKK